MKHSLYYFALLLLLAGCKTASEAVHSIAASTEPTYVICGKSIAESNLSSAEKVELLTADAKKKGLRWEVFRVPKDDGTGTDHFQADAKQATEPGGAIYAEDGAKPWWAGIGATPEEAAFDLYKEIQHGPTHEPDHRPKSSVGDYGTVLDSKHATAYECRDGKDEDE